MDLNDVVVVEIDGVRWRSDHASGGDSQQRFLFVKLKENERGRGRWRSGGVRSEE
jgi:hypothetical protein